MTNDSLGVGKSKKVQGIDGEQKIDRVYARICVWYEMRDCALTLRREYPFMVGPRLLVLVAVQTQLILGSFPQKRSSFRDFYMTRVVACSA
jgi:hypothetical protein